MRGLRIIIKNKEIGKEQQNELLTCDRSGNPGRVRVCVCVCARARVCVCVCVCVHSERIRTKLRIN